MAVVDLPSPFVSPSVVAAILAVPDFANLPKRCSVGGTDAG